MTYEPCIIVLMLSSLRDSGRPILFNPLLEPPLRPLPVQPWFHVRVPQVLRSCDERASHTFRFRQERSIETLIYPFLQPSPFLVALPMNRPALNPPDDPKRKHHDAQVLCKLGEHRDVPRGGEEVGLEVGRDEGEEGGEEREEGRGRGTRLWEAKAGRYGKKGRGSELHEGKELV